MNTRPIDTETPDAQTVHLPVLLDEALHWLQPRPGGIYCDATVGYAGHAREILQKSDPDGRLIAIDRDENALAHARAQLAPFGDRVHFAHAPFSDFEQVLRAAGVDGVDGCLADLGVSSPQLDRPERGFSFRESGPLDMRMDQRIEQTAAQLVAQLEEQELADLIYRLGEERHSRRIARAICRARQTAAIETTGELAEVVAKAVGAGHQKTHPATKTFQALRLAVNDELGQVEALMQHVPPRLNPGGRLVVISFHSLEDRIVKTRMRALAQAPKTVAPGEGLPPEDAGPEPILRVLTKRVITAGDDELQRNARARSAKLRAAERLPQNREAA